MNVVSCHRRRTVEIWRRVRPRSAALISERSLESGSMPRSCGAVERKGIAVALFKSGLASRLSTHRLTPPAPPATQPSRPLLPPTPVNPPPRRHRCRGGGGNRRGRTAGGAAAAAGWIGARPTRVDGADSGKKQASNGETRSGGTRGTCKLKRSGRHSSKLISPSPSTSTECISRLISRRERPRSASRTHACAVQSEQVHPLRAWAEHCSPSVGSPGIPSGRAFPSRRRQHGGRERGGLPEDRARAVRMFPRRR